MERAKRDRSESEEQRVDRYVKKVRRVEGREEKSGGSRDKVGEIREKSGEEGVRVRVRRMRRGRECSEVERG
jgi:hypothetical protein